MNYAEKIYILERKLSSLFRNLQFKLFQRPLWKLSYNSNGNKFVCNGKLQNCKILIKGIDNTLIIENGVLLINTEINISGSGHTVILKKGCIISEKGMIRVEDTGNTVIVGEKTHISGVFLAASDYNTKIEIGENCLFSANIIVRTSDSHSILNAENERINPGEDVIIGNSVWVGYGATILKGSVIGDNCIVGTESIVPGKNIPAGSIVVGNSGKIVKTGIHWCKERIKTD